MVIIETTLEDLLAANIPDVEDGGVRFTFNAPDGTISNIVDIHTEDDKYKGRVLLMAQRIKSVIDGTDTE